MKTFKSIALSLIFSLALVCTYAGASFAEEMEHSKGDIQMLRDAATALKATNPDLSAKLSKYADREANEREEAEKYEKNEKK